MKGRQSSLKNIITILLTIVVAILTLKGVFDIKDIYLMIIAFYFGSQSEKKSNDK